MLLLQQWLLLLLPLVGGGGGGVQAGAIIYACRVPERWFPGKFDIAGKFHLSRGRTLTRSTTTRRTSCHAKPPWVGSLQCNSTGASCLGCSMPQLFLLVPLAPVACATCLLPALCM